jgi:hypothetical protein
VARPPFQATDKQRSLVKSLAGFGFTHQEIATFLELKSPKTLRKHFRAELDLGEIQANAKVAQTLFNLATSGQHPAATIFWMKTRRGWRERDGLETLQAPPPFLVTAERKPVSACEVVPIDRATKENIVPERAA